MAVLQLKQRPTFLAGHPAIEDLAALITTVARALQQRERRISQTLRDMGYADGCVPDTRNVRAPLDVRRDARTVQAPVWRPFALSKETVTGGVGLLNLLHFAKDTAQQTNRVLPLLVEENIHYRILKLLYGAKNQRWNMRAYLRYVPVVYGVWHAYTFVVTHTFRVFWPILTYLRKRLLRPGSTILSYAKLIVMEKNIAALMLATPRILRPYWRKAQAATVISGRDTAHVNRAAVANAVLHLLSEWCPLFLYLGHVVRECNWSGENSGTGSRAQEVLQLSLCLLRRLRRGPCDTVLKYERTIMCTLLYNSKWHRDLPGQAHSEEFGEGMLSKLVRDKARNTGSVTVEEVENHYLLLKVGPGGKHVGVQNVPKNLVHRMRQHLTRSLATDRNLHGLCGMGVEQSQHGCNFVAAEVTEISTLTYTTPCLRPLPATWSQRTRCPHRPENKSHQPTKTKTGCWCWAENRHGCRQTGSSNTQHAATVAVPDARSARGLAH